jgi:hypothetical protein
MSSSNGEERERRYRGMFSPEDRMVLQRLRRKMGTAPDLGRSLRASYVEGDDTVALLMHTDIDVVAKEFRNRADVHPNETYADTVRKIERYFLSFIRELRKSLSILNNPSSSEMEMSQVDFFIRLGSLKRLKDTLNQAGYRVSPLYDNLTLLEHNMMYAYQAHPGGRSIG